MWGTLEIPLSPVNPEPREKGIQNRLRHRRERLRIVCITPGDAGETRSLSPRVSQASRQSQCLAVKDTCGIPIEFL